MKFHNLSKLVLTSALCASLVPTVVFAADLEPADNSAWYTEAQINGTQATTVSDEELSNTSPYKNQSRDYNGTNVVTDYQAAYRSLLGVRGEDDDLGIEFGYVTGEVESANAGTYDKMTVTDFTSANIPNASNGSYDYSVLPVEGTGLYFTINKVVAQLSISAPEEVAANTKTVEVEVSLENHFNRFEGIPSAEEMNFNVEGGKLVDVQVLDNTYVLTIELSTDAKEVLVNANVTDNATNYLPAETEVRSTTKINDSKNDDKATVTKKDEKKSQTPPTGDVATTGLWASMMTVGMAAVVVALKKRLAE